ncbi:hypothetical protein R3P38DRAFT_3230513 [Favolaschia claudopus]|uniref:Uncharacterized protein n=1 Tax=Favolaschia claudopus TaxID=2862362 RepID=A0AAV9ZLX3_9AGAR
MPSSTFLPSTTTIDDFVPQPLTTTSHPAARHRGQPPPRLPPLLTLSATTPPVLANPTKQLPEVSQSFPGLRPSSSPSRLHPPISMIP